MERGTKVQNLKPSVGKSEWAKLQVFKKGQKSQNITKILLILLALCGR